ncbi:hypothetical protein [Salinibius halmophilus]|uniref:hypothetical protein n=1 Tax=Salinibius halmophilus TaxID=1853216 RepID=UPI000E66038C|nr:hypothetical protein [Salinibius halmophilus]
MKALLVLEWRLQWRHGFWAAAGVLTLVWFGLLWLLPAWDRAFWFGIVAAVDITAIGLLFGYGLSVLEGNQNVQQPVRMTPVRSWQIMLARVFWLWLMMTTVQIALALPLLPWGAVLLMAPGMLLNALFFACVGVLVPKICQSLNQFIVLFSLTGILWALPILAYADVVQLPYWWLLPSGGGCYLLAIGSQNLFGWQLGAAGVAQFIWALVALGWALKWDARSGGHRFGGNRA